MKIKSMIQTNYFLFTVVVAFNCLVSIFCNAQIESKLKAPILSSEAPVLRFEKLGVEDGLTQGDVSTIIQDKRGFIWMGTQTGLHRYDGHEFKVFASRPFDTTSLSSSRINSIYESSNGNLWVTTEGGLNRLNPTTGKAVHYKNDPADSTSISTNDVQKVFESSNGDLWVGTSGFGLNRMRKGEDGIFRKYQHDPEDANSIGANSVLDIGEDHDGYIWVGTAHGLSRIEPESDSIVTYMHFKGYKAFAGDSVNVNTLHIPSDNKKIIWLGTGYGLVRFNRETGKYQRFLIEANESVGNSKNSFRDITSDPNDPNVLWLASLEGIARFDMRTQQFTRYRHDPKDKNSISSNFVFTLFVDRSGMMWAGTTIQGVNKFNPGAVNFNHIKNNPDDPSSLAPGFVWGIHEDKEGSLWVSTVGSPFYLTQFDARSEQVTRHQHDPTNTSTLLGGRVNVFVEDDQGGFWVGGPGGLNLLDRSTGKVKRFLREPGVQNRGRNNIRALVLEAGDPNKLWVGSRGGLDLLDTRTGVYTNISLAGDSTQQDRTVWSLLYDSQGSLWIGSSLGLMKRNSSGVMSLISVHNSKDITTISSNSIFCMLERKKERGILWLANTEWGLDRLDTRTGSITHVSKEDGLPNNTVYGILEDDQGTLWMSTNNGICNYDPDTKQVRNYGLSDGLLALEYNAYAFAKGKNGRMYFGNSEGVTAFTPALLRKNARPPQVVITDVKLFNKSITAGIDAPYLKSSSTDDGLTLEYNQNELTIEYVALHFGNPEMNRYAYQLEGFDKNWVDAGTKRTATYTNLPPGEFTFKVKAANADGIWNEQGVSFTLHVLPPWYRTWWAYTLLVFLFIGSIYAIDRTQRKRLLQKEHERNQQKELEQAREIEKAYNQLKSTQAQLIQSEKMASLGELTAGIAHEIQNPLNFVNNFSEVSSELIDEMKTELATGNLQQATEISNDLKQNLEKINHHGKRASDIVSGMLQHSRASSGVKEPTNINALADEYLRLAYHGLRAKDKNFNAKFETELDASLPKLNVVPQDIGRVILNLITNAFYAVSTVALAKVDSEYTPTVSVSTKKEGNKVLVSVKDNGNGIPPKILDKIFQPFFTTKPTGQGTGLGLSLSYDIVKAHGGELRVETKDGEGSTFTIQLPLS
ncbi:MAG: GHKL domain-containing protein [Cyclobacteriaceae bacterium]|nr:GHKL domain-containing protein [Cyclobacteriaceae bacterium]